MNKNLIYDVNQKPKRIREWILYSLQQVFAVFVASVLIAQICQTPISSCLLGACIGTLTYQIITKFKSPMFISSSGATCSAVIGALALPGISNQNYLMVACGGVIIALVYIIFAFVVKFQGIGKLNKIFPPTIIGSVTMVIGLNLAGFLTTYTHNSNVWEVVVAIITMIIIAISSHYFKGFLKTIPFLIGLICGYLISLSITLLGWAELVSFDAFKHMEWYPDVTFLKWNIGDFSWNNLLQVVILFVPVSICALLEHYSDHKCLSNIIGTDLTINPGLDRTLVGDGVASAIGTIVCGLPNTSYGESVATVGFSRVASVSVITTSAIFIGLLSFFGPVSAFIQTIPSCVFGGCSMILYGYIASSGLKTLINNKVNLENNKNLIITSVILTSGVGGIILTLSLGSMVFSFSGVALSMILGVILNLILKEKSNE